MVCRSVAEFPTASLHSAGELAEGGSSIKLGEVRLTAYAGVVPRRDAYIRELVAALGVSD